MDMFNAQSTRDFAKAQQLAFMERCLNLLKGFFNNLFSFEAIGQNIKLLFPVDKGLQEIKLDKIVDSVNKFKSRDFSRTFLPKSSGNEDRWRRVDDLFHNQWIEPIEVYKVGQVYFVRDGHHRISINRTQGINTIEAYVTEYKTEVSIDKYDDLLIFLRKGKYALSHEAIIDEKR